MRKLPLDTSVFARIIELNYVYVDKTEYIYRMITQGHRFFLSRPRRFGKSLLVSTLHEILAANKKLFKDLWIEQSDYRWHEYGVITLDFSRLIVDDIPTLQNRLCNLLEKNAQRYNLSLNINTNAPDLVLEELVEKLYKQFGRVAILIDEYDSPIIKTLYNEDLAKKVRDTMQQFFAIIKALDEYVQFVFITGVSSFAKAGLFSGINNLQILSLDKRFAGICGYTDEEIDYYFKEHLASWATNNNESLDILRNRIKTWYNGYHFGHNAIAVYNPFSVAHSLSIQEFNNFWFQSGTPTFLVDILKKNYKQFDPNSFQASKDFLGIFDVGNIPTISLMFQAGYLTIIDYNAESELYILDYPNLEVKKAFQKYLLEVFAHIEPMHAARLSSELYQAFEQQNIEKIIELLKQLFAHVPYQLHIKAESYYHSLFMMICIGAGIKAQSEYSTNIGSIDLVLEFLKIIYVIEVKFNKTAEEAMEQIEARRYYEKFMNQNKEIILLGLNFQRKPQSFDITYILKQL